MLRDSPLVRGDVELVGVYEDDDEAIAIAESLVAPPAQRHCADGETRLTP